MRHLSISLLALIAAAPAFAEDVYTQAPVVAATVYPNGADLTHRATVELSAGEHRLFLPYAGIDDLSSLPRIRTTEGVTIGALGFRRGVRVDRKALFTDAQAAAWAKVEAAQQALDAKTDEIATARAEVVALQARLAFLAAVKPGEDRSAEDLIALANTLKDENAASQTALVVAEAALRPLGDDLTKLKGALDAANVAFERLAPPDAVTDMLSVEVSVAEAGPVSLELTELTAQAGWEMDYDLDLDRAAGALSVSRKLIVSQYSDTSWNDVALTLSTARPGEEVSPNPVFPDLARIAEPMVLGRAAGAEPEAMMEMVAPMAVPSIIVDDAMKTAGLQIDGLALSYVYPDPVSIATKEATELALDELTLEAAPAIHASPRSDTTAFTVAHFTNTTQEPILPGWANILRDGHFVGREWIDMIPAGAETDLGFGPIEGIRLAMFFERNAEGDTGFISKANTREQTIVFTVENLTGETQQVRAFYPLTFSEQEDLRVRIAATPAPDETDIDRKRGVSAWDLSLAPGETRDVSITVKLDWPEGQNLVWHP